MERSRRAFNEGHKPRLYQITSTSVVCIVCFTNSQTSKHSPENIINIMSAIIPSTQTTTSLFNIKVRESGNLPSLPPTKTLIFSQNPRYEALPNQSVLEAMLRPNLTVFVANLEAVLPFHVSNVQQNPWRTFHCNPDWFTGILVSWIIIVNP